MIEPMQARSPPSQRWQPTKAASCVVLPAPVKDSQPAPPIDSIILSYLKIFAFSSQICFVVNGRGTPGHLRGRLRCSADLPRTGHANAAITAGVVTWSGRVCFLSARALRPGGGSPSQRSAAVRVSEAMHWSRAWMSFKTSSGDMLGGTLVKDGRCLVPRGDMGKNTRSGETK
jgi:hypothetical protein